MPKTQVTEANNQMTDLFYVLDLGDTIAALLAQIKLPPFLAGVIGHLVSFGINAALWIGVIKFAVDITA